jgi:hypothetical protein
VRVRRRTELGHLDEPLHPGGPGRGGHGRGGVEQAVGDRVGEEHPVHADHGRLDVGDVAKVADDRLRAQLAQPLGPLVERADERAHLHPALQQQLRDAPPGRALRAARRTSHQYRHGSAFRFIF